MPFLPPDTPHPYAVLPPRLPDPEKPTDSPSPGVGEVMRAALSRENVLGAATAKYGASVLDFSPTGIANTALRLKANRDFLNAARDPTYDWQDDVEGYEFHSRRFVRSESREESMQIKRAIDRETKADQLIHEAGGWGVAAAIGAGLVDPITAFSLAIPGAVGLRGAKAVGGAVASSAALDTASEFALHAFQETRTKEESLINVGAGVLLTGVLGSIAARVPRADLQKLERELGAELFDNAQRRGDSAGAAAVGADTTLAEEGAAGVGKYLAKTLGKISPAARVLSRESRTARQVVQDLAEISFTLGRNARGLSTSVAVETLVKRYDSVLAHIATGTDDAYTNYVKRIKASGEERLSSAQFRDAVSAAMRRGDQSNIPEVATFAQQLRSGVIEPLTKELQKVGLLRDPVKAAQEALDEQTVADFYSKELRGIVDDFIARGGDGSEDVAIEAIRKIRAQRDKDIEVTRAKMTSSSVSRTEREYVELIDSLERFVNQKRKSNPDSLIEITQRDDPDRLMARYLEKHLDELPDEVMRVLSRQSVMDLETGEWLNALDDSIRGGHIGQLRRLREEVRDKDAGVWSDMDEYFDQTRTAEREYFGAETQLNNAELARAIQQIEAHARREIDKIEPALIQRLDQRAKAHLEGRGAEVDRGVTKLSELMRRRADGKILDVDVPRKLTDVKGFDVVGALSYLPRLYNAAAINANRLEWDRALKNWYVAQGLEPVEAETLTKDITRSILGSARGYVELDPSVVAKAGNLQSRILEVPDEILEPFLVNDVEKVLTQYIRSVAPQLELQRRFGSLDMKEQIQKISDEYGVLQARAKTAAERTKLEKELNKTVKDIEGMRQRLLGKLGVPMNPDHWLVTSGRLFRDYNYIRLLGSQVASSFADVGRIVSQYGLARTALALGRFAVNLGQWKLAREDAKRMGIGLDWLLNTRGSSFAEIGEYAETRAQDISRSFTSGFSRITGMATWNSSMKFLAAALQQDEILRLAKAKTLKPRQIEQLASIGIDRDMLARIGQQFDKHGVDEGLRRARSELWSDDAAAKEAAMVFEAAMLKAADTAVLTKGIGDTPLLMSNEVAKTLFQFKGFGMAAVNRLLIPVAQGIQRGDVAMMNGMSLMLALGVMRYMSKQWTSDQPIDTSPGSLIREAIDGSGFISYLAEPYDIASRLSGDRLPMFSRYSDRSLSETLGGPTAGSIDDLLNAAAKASKDGMQSDDVHRIRKLLPLQNLFYIRRLINQMEDATGEWVGVEE